MKPYFTKLSPFEIAFYDVRNKRIVVDEQFKDSPVLDYIINHELKHSRSKGNIDIIQELEKTPRWAVNLMRKKKPLSSFAFVVPMTKYKDHRGKTILGLDFSRLLMLTGLLLFFYTLYFFRSFLFW